MLTARLSEALAWRWWLLRRYWFLLRKFRNGRELIRAWRNRRPCDVAVCRDGTRLVHPTGRGGLVETILEVWYSQVYAPDGFYRPAPGDCVIDAGANVGLFTIWVARQNPSCRVHALEPFPENFDCLRANLDSAKVRSTYAHQIALGGRPGVRTMVAGGARSLDHRLAESDGDGGTRVPVIDLSGLFELAETDRVAFLKVDIEGAEYEAFQAADAGLLSRIDRLAIEYHDHMHAGTLDLLRQRLGGTHHVSLRPEPGAGYGMLLAELRK